MESLKLPKSGSGASTPTGKSSTGAVNSGNSNVSVTVRFNAGDECVESIYSSFQNNSGNSGGVNSNSPSSAGSIGTSIDNTALMGGSGDSLASSPSQHQSIDDQANRNNFLQGNFFNRKRSGSIEGISPTLSGPNLIATLGNTEAGGSSVGTWKLFKGKVSQTFEEIKSSKSNTQFPISATFSKGQIQIEPDSDQESTTLSFSASEVLSIDAEAKQQQQQQSSYHQQQHYDIHREAVDSDSDIDSEVLLEGDVERSRLRRGLANLKSKVKAKAAAAHHHHHHQQQHHHIQPHATAALATAIGVTAIKTTMPKKNNLALPPTATATAVPAPTTSLRSTFLRKRRKQPVDTAELASPSATIEEPIPMMATCTKTDKKKKDKDKDKDKDKEKEKEKEEDKEKEKSNEKGKGKEKEKGVIAGKREIEIESGVEMLEEMTPNDVSDKSSNVSKVRFSFSQPIVFDSHSINSESFEPKEKTLNTINYDKYEMVTPSSIGMNVRRPRMTWSSLKPHSYMPLTTIAFLSAVLIMPIHDFIRGAVATVLGVVTLETIFRCLGGCMANGEPERSRFKVPDYSNMPILEIPAAEEHKTIKSYSGWMNEVNSYDPNNYHVSMTKSVFIKLEGTVLRLSSTNARIPKKVLWNEPPIENSTLAFTEHRVYDLFGCRVELLPLGLARKRYFNRKYPIQLIIPNNPEKQFTDEYLSSHSNSSASKQPSASSLTDYYNLNIQDSKTAQQTAATPRYNAVRGNTDDFDLRNDCSVSDTDLDFASTILNADLQYLHDSINPDLDTKELTVPRGDEVRLLLFSRGDREKEDWYRRFLAASNGDVHDQNLRLPNAKFVQNANFQLKATKSAQLLTNAKSKDGQSGSNIAPDEFKSTISDLNFNSSTLPLQTNNSMKDSVSAMKLSSNVIDKDIKSLPTPSKSNLMPEMAGAAELDEEPEMLDAVDDDSFEGLLMSACVARNPVDYVRFMANYQKACKLNNIPVFKRSLMKKSGKENRKHRRARRQENDLWKGIDQSLFLGPSGSVVWANVLFGRFMYSCLHDPSVGIKLKDLFQRKLSSVKLPSFMENVIITEIHLGEVSPLIHRVSQPMLDERGTWLDADITYEGYCYITVTTKLNLLRLKRQARPNATTLDPNVASSSTAMGTATPSPPPPPINVVTSDIDGNPSFYSTASQPVNSSINGDNLMEEISGSAIFDSDAESSGGSSSESESPVGTGPTTEGAAPTEGNARRLFKLVDRFTASNLFQYATEISYVQRAMENMNANITLRVELRGLVARGVINLPPPPSDRIWLAFRGPPRLWISAKPTVGDKSFDWSIVTNVIESKLCEQVNRYLVYPNMVDITIPFLGQPTYKE